MDNVRTVAINRQRAIAKQLRDADRGMADRMAGEVAKRKPSAISTLTSAAKRFVGSHR